MFKQLFNFGFQRTGLQAFGWYLFFLLICGLIGGLCSALAAILGYIPANDFMANLHFGERLAPVVPMMVCVVLFFEKPITPVSIVVSLVGAIIALFAGWFLGGILLAFLTTRPSRETVASPSIGLREDSWRRR